MRFLRLGGLFHSCSENYFYLCHHCFWNTCPFRGDEWWVLVVESGSHITKPKPNTKTIWFQTDLVPFKHLQSSSFSWRRPQVISLSMGGNHQTKHPSVSKRWLALEYQVPGKKKTGKLWNWKQHESQKQEIISPFFWKCNFKSRTIYGP